MKIEELRGRVDRSEESGVGERKVRRMKKSDEDEMERERKLDGNKMKEE